MTAAQPYLAVSRRPLDLEDYFSVARRHSAWIAGPAFAGLVISTVIAFCLPNVYEAMAVMQITPSRINENLVQSTSSQQLTERIMQMKSNITSRQSLASIINDPHLNLYREELKKEPLDEVEDEMRAAISIGLNPESVTKKGASNFSISFRYKTKKGAMDTVNLLITKFIQESATSQHDTQTTIQEYFSDELNQAKANLDKQQEALTRFRTENEGRLPEQEGMNLESLRAFNAQLASINQELNRLANDRVTLDTHIVGLENSLKLNASFAEEADNTLVPTGAVARQNDELLGINKTIENMELNLQALQQKYRDSFSEVKTAKSNLEIMRRKRDEIVAEQARRQAEEAAKPKPEAAPKRTNFRALEQENTIKSEIAKYRALQRNNDSDRDLRLKARDAVSKQIEEYQARLAATTALVAPYADLQRDYAAAAEKYQKAQLKKDITAQNADLASRHVNENLETLDAPTMPQKETSPKRPLIIGAGFAVSLVLGLVLAGVQEARDASLKNLKDVRAYTNLPVLCSIPLLENTLLVKRKRRITALAWSAAVIVGLLAVGGALFYYQTVISNS